MTDNDLQRSVNAEAASVAASLASILTGFTVASQLEYRNRQGSTASVASALASFASLMASIAAAPSSEMERLTASTAASMASVLASFAESLGGVR